MVLVGLLCQWVTSLVAPRETPLSRFVRRVHWPAELKAKRHLRSFSLSPLFIWVDKRLEVGWARAECENRVLCAAFFWLVLKVV